MLTTSQIFLVLLLPVCNNCYCDSSHFYQRHIYIDGGQGNDSVDCLRSGRLFPCKTLNYATHVPSDNTKYLLSAGRHYLNITISFNGRQNVGFFGNSSSCTSGDTLVICTHSESGLEFNRSSNLIFQHFSLTSCSFSTGVSDLHSDQYQHRAALFFYRCVQSIYICNVRISNSSDATALVLLDTSDQITVVNSVFDNNGPYGRGVQVQTSDNFPLAQNLMYNFTNCLIKDNSAIFKSNENDDESCTPLQKRNHTHNHYGGGMSVVLRNNDIDFTTVTKLNIVGTNFTGNMARCGGGLHLAMESKSPNNRVLLRNCLFENNTCPYDIHTSKRSLVTYGGGIRIELLNTCSTKGQANITIQNCKFKNNSALSGGGLSISPLAHSDTLLNVELENTHFCNNSGNVGAAIQASLVAPQTRTNPPNISIINSSFSGNYIQYKNKSAYKTGIGSVYANKVSVTFHGNILFVSNKGSAVAIVGAFLIFDDCFSNFTMNKGARGGAIALLGAADMIVSDSSEMTFSNNRASLYGGAIYNEYIEQENLIAYFNCFVRSTNPLQPLNANFTFIDNSATMTGRSIFTTSVLPCGPISHNVLCSPRWTYKHHGNMSNCSKEITTEPMKIKNGDAIKTTPGEIYSLNLSIIDDLGHDVNELTVFAAHMQHKYKHSVSVDPQFKYISDQKVVINGESGFDSANLHLHTTGNRVWHVRIPVDLLDCPPGFSLLSKDEKKSRSSSQCKCDPTHSFNGILSCKQAQFESFIAFGYWMGSQNDTQEDLVVSLCPPNYCAEKVSNTQRVYVTNITSRKKICHHRKGVLCGECEENFGPAVNSYALTCRNCTENFGKKIAIYVFSVYGPLLILFSLMIIFGVRLTTGPENAFIFYSQVISSNFNIDADGHIKLISLHNFKALNKAYRLPYGLFNLEFVENILNPFCLSPRLNALDIFQLDYLVALTPLAMILIVLVCLKLKRCCVRVAPSQITTTAQSFLAKQKSGEYLLHAFAAFTLLSYTKLGLTSAYIIRSSYMYNATGGITSVVYFAGQYNVADGYYLARYFFPACFVLAIITLPPLFLLGYPVIWLEKCLVRCPMLWKRYPVDKVHILLDIFQSCYKDDRRYFAGLYFLFRYALNIVYITTSDWIQRFMVQQIMFTVVLVILAVCWPYKKEKRYLNYVDLFFFANLTVINALSFYIYYRLHSDIQYTEPINAFVVQYALVFLPLVYMIIYCGWKLVGEKRRKKFQRFCKNIIRRNGLEDSDEFDSVINRRQSDVSQTTEGDHSNRQSRMLPTTSEVTVNSSEYENVENGDETLMIRSRARNTYKASKSEGLRPQPPGSTQRSSLSLVSSRNQRRKSPDSGVSTSRSHSNSLRRPSPLVPILSVEDATKHYGATD